MQYISFVKNHTTHVLGPISIAITIKHLIRKMVNGNIKKKNELKCSEYNKKKTTPAFLIKIE